MGRLTKINEDACQFCKSWDYCIEEEPCFLYEVYEKLGDYEDLEEQLMESAEIDIDSMVGEFMHYYNLQKENRLIELPCAVGDTVWEIDEYAEGFKVRPMTVLSIELKKSKGYVYTTYSDEHDVFARGYGFDDFGNILFLTKEEAEKRLQELQGNE